MPPQERLPSSPEAAHESPAFQQLKTLFGRNDLAVGRDVGVHHGSPAEAKKMRDAILAARNNILSSGEDGPYGALYKIFSRFFHQEERDGDTYNTYTYEEDAMNAISRWGELAREERVTGHYKYSLSDLRLMIEGILDTIVGRKGSALHMVDTFPTHETHIRNTAESYQTIDRIEGWDTVAPFLIECVDRLSRMDMERDDPSETALLLTAVSLHAKDALDALRPSNS